MKFRLFPNYKAALLLFSSLIYHGQTVGQSFLGNPTSFLDSEAFRPEFISSGDFNNDGLMDLFLLDYDTLYWIPQKTDGTFGSLVSLLTPEFPFSELVTRDFNVDGYLDIVVSSPGGMALYTNDGQENLVEQADFPNSGSYDGKIQIVDLDNNGKPGIVHGTNWHPDIDESLNGNAQASVTLIDANLTNFNPVSDIQFGDLDNDNILDITFRNDRCYVSYNDGNENFAPEVVEEMDINHDEHVSYITPFDVDNDGKLDLLGNHSEFSSAFNSRQLLWHKSMGSGDFADPAWLGNFHVRKIESADITNSGSNEMIYILDSGNSSGKIRTFERSADGILEPAQNVLRDDLEATDFHLVDVGNDGFKDVVYVNYSTYKVGLVKNNGDGIFEEIELLADTFRFPDWVASRDLNDNGMSDYIIKHEDAFSIFFDWGQGGQQKSQSILVTTSSIHDIDNLAFHDIDNDGLEDIIAYRSSEIYWFKNLGSGNYGEQETFIDLDSNGRLNDAIEFVDLNADGFVDILAGDVAYLATGPSFLSPTNLVIDLIPVPRASIMGDFDSDGDLDIFAVDADFRLVWYENDGSGNFGLPNTLINNINVNLLEWKVTDFDNDGIDELVVKNDNGMILCQNENGADSATFLTLDTVKDFSVGDLNGDGHGDMVGVTNASVQIYFNDGQNSLLHLVDLDYNEGFIRSSIIDDFNNDGVPDIGLLEENRLQYLSVQPNSQILNTSFETNECGGVEILNTSIVFAPDVDVLWEFGDGNSSTNFHLDHESYEYQSIGTYNLSLTLCNDLGCDSYSETIEVNYIPGVVIPEEAVVNEPINFSCAAVGYDAVSWVLGDGTISNETEFTHTYTLPGTYTVELFLTDSELSGCTEQREYSLFISEWPLGLPDKIEIEIDVWPNPSEEFVHLSTEGEKINKVLLFSRLGKLIYEAFPSSNYFDFSVKHFPSGMYFLSLELENGLTQTSKVILK